MFVKFPRLLALAALTAVAIAGVSAVALAHGDLSSTRSTATATVRTQRVAPASTIPPRPVTHYTADVPFFETDGLGQYGGATNSAALNSGNAGYFTSGYWVDVPRSYNRSNRTPETLVVWLHGCSGLANWEVKALTSIYDSNRPYILMALSGPEGGNYGGPVCWDTSDQTDVKKVLTDIAQVETHFNINHRRVIIGGYSSGGDLAYQTIFTHADEFAGMLAFNTDPVRDNTFRDSISRAIAAAAWKFPIFQVIHAQDQDYPPSLVGPHLKALAAAGFPVHDIIRPGNHFNDGSPAGCSANSCKSGTYYDIAHFLLPQIASDGWEAPGS